MKSDTRPWLSTYESMGHDWHTLPELPEKTLSDYVRGYAWVSIATAQGHAKAKKYSK